MSEDQETFIMIHSYWHVPFSCIFCRSLIRPKVNCHTILFGITAALVKFCKDHLKVIGTCFLHIKIFRLDLNCSKLGGRNAVFCNIMYPGFSPAKFQVT